MRKFSPPGLPICHSRRVRGGGGNWIAGLSSYPGPFAWLRGSSYAHATEIAAWGWMAQGRIIC